MSPFEPEILVIQLERLGDLIQTTPLIMELMAGRPAGAVDLLVAEEAKPGIEGLPGIGTIRSLPARLVTALGKEIDASAGSERPPARATTLLAGLAFPRYRAIINATQVPLGAWITQQLDAGEKLGGILTGDGEWLYRGDWLTYLIALLDFRDRNGLNVADIFRGAGRSLVRETLERDGIRTPFVATAPEPAVIFPEGFALDRLVLLNPGANRIEKCWTAEGFARLAELLKGAGWEPVLFGSAADKAASDAVAAACSIPLLDTTGATDIPRGASLVARAKLIVTNDTGALHIAAAAGTPAVAVCGASSWIRETAPWAEGHVLLQAPSGPASPANSGRPQSKVPEGADPLEVLPAELALACCLYGLGVSKPAVLRKALDAAGAAAWETRFIPAGVDPIGGLDLVPLHTDSPDAAAVFDRILRHLFAWDFTSGSNSPIDDAAIGRYLSGAREAGIVTGKPGLKTLLATVRKMTQQLEEMAAEASRVASLFSAGGEASSSERRRLLEDLVAKGETLCDPETVPPALAPVTMTLDWQLRMMAPGSPLEVLEAHRERYHRAATILEKAAAIVKRLAAA